MSDFLYLRKLIFLFHYDKFLLSKYFNMQYKIKEIVYLLSESDA